LRACRDTLPRTTQKLNVGTGEKKQPPTATMTGRIWVDDESFKSASQARLSQAFDSTEATLRLASLTNTEEEVDELAKTLKIIRPTPEKTIPAPPVVKPAPPVPPAHKATIPPYPAVQTATVSPTMGTSQKTTSTATKKPAKNTLLIVFFVLLGLFGIATLILSS
jgi:hypothetical protein